MAPGRSQAHRGRARFIELGAPSTRLGPGSLTTSTLPTRAVGLTGRVQALE